jgi:SPP1 family predicted phage head-tail adaptor
MSGKELEQARQISEEITLKATIRYYPALTTEYRITNDANTYEIANILNFREKDCYQTVMLKVVK